MKKGKEMDDIVKDYELQNFFLEHTANLYDAEKKFMKCFVALSISAYADELRTALNTPSTEAETHISRLEQILTTVGNGTQSGECEVVTALIEKSNNLIKNNEPGTPIRDAAIIFAAQLIQHYKIASYSVLQPIAVELGLEQASMLLEQCLTDEKNTAAYLTQIAQNITNPAARGRD